MDNHLKKSKSVSIIKAFGSNEYSNEKYSQSIKQKIYIKNP
jgi:hypothetical protein